MISRPAAAEADFSAKQDEISLSPIRLKKR